MGSERFESSLWNRVEASGSGKFGWLLLVRRARSTLTPASRGTGGRVCDERKESMISASTKRVAIPGTGRELVTCAVCSVQFEAYRSNYRVVCSAACSTVVRSRQRVPEHWPRVSSIWRGMLFRCHNEKSPAWEYYGGRGITVCDEWRESVSAFYEWAIASGYGPALEIDRRDINAGYSPDNCRWATRSQQMQNTRKKCDAVTSRYRGVSWCTNASKWRAQLSGAGRRSPHIGLFLTEVEAARAYDAVAKQEFGEFASLNFV